MTSKTRCSNIRKSIKLQRVNKNVPYEWVNSQAIGDHSTGQLAKLFKTSLSVREAQGSIHGLVKSDAVSPTARHRSDVSSELCSPGPKPRGPMEMGPTTRYLIWRNITSTMRFDFFYLEDNSMSSPQCKNKVTTATE